MKIYILHLSLFFALFILMQSSSCSNKNKPEEEMICTPQNTVLVPQDLKDRFFFKEGTYWIYKNLQTNETDSIWVLSYTEKNITAEDLEPNANIKNKCYQFLRCITTNKTLFNNGLFLSNYANNLIVKGSGESEIFGINEISSLTSKSVIYRVDYIDGIYSSSEGAEIMLIDSLEIQSNIYNSLIQFKYPTGFQTQDYIDDMYYAEKIGLVKFHRFTDTSNWELIRYKIVQ